MDKFQSTYISLINEMNSQQIKNLADNISFSGDVDRLFRKADTFEGKALPYTHYKYVGYTDWSDVDIEVELTDNKTAYVRLEEDCEIEYDWSPYEPQTWEQPGNPGGVDQINCVSWPFSKDLNSKLNDDVIYVELFTETESDIQTKFTALSMQDRYLILSALSDYFDTDDFLEKLDENLRERAEDCDPDY